MENDKVKVFLDIMQSLGSKTEKDVSEQPPYEKSSKSKEAREYFKAMKKASNLLKNEPFETFNALHLEYASDLIDIFYRIPLDKLKAAVNHSAKMLNARLHAYTLSVALRHRKDFIESKIHFPSHVNLFPEMYFDVAEITQKMNDDKYSIKLQKKVDSEEQEIHVVNIEYNFTATDQDLEHKVAYFREDIGYALHHGRWHDIYPFNGPKELVMKDRRGELFYYMHCQMRARYDFERFSNGLSRKEPFTNFRKPIPSAYFNKLNALGKQNKFGSRAANDVLKDVRRFKNDLIITLETMELWRDRLFDAIDKGYAYVKDKDSGQVSCKKIEEPSGINELGNSVEASPLLSWNADYYGDLHNKGHMMAAYCHDPDNTYMENGNVMGYTELSQRDPFFYAWHGFVDEIFQRYKRKLKPYTLQEKRFQGIEIKDVKVIGESGVNVLETFWEQDLVDVTKVLVDGFPEHESNTKKVYANFVHLQHEPFQYKIEVNNNLKRVLTGTVRIFLAPKKSENGARMEFNEQRRMFIEMDKFVYNFEPGETVIERESKDSSVTIPFERTFMTINQIIKLAIKRQNQTLESTDDEYCGCGWPHHLLIGKGTPEGLECDLFVMITDHELDKVESTLQCCNKQSYNSYCGTRDSKYPDKKPMGFPFDRDIAPRSSVEDFITEDQELLENDESEKSRILNMMVVETKVKHLGGKPRPGVTIREHLSDEEYERLFNKN